MSLKSSILKKLKDTYSTDPKWNNISEEITNICLEFPTLYEDKDFEKSIKLILELENKLKEYGFSKDSYDFLSADIEQLSSNSTLAIHKDKVSELPDEVIDKYCRIGVESEGVIGIPQSYTAEQLKVLSNGVYKNSGLVKFFISSETDISGKIISEIYDRAQEIPIASLVQTIRRNQESGIFNTEVRLFGEGINKKEWTILKEVKSYFYIYNFVSSDDKQYIIYSTQKLNIGDYKLIGVTIDNDDFKLITDTAKIKTKLLHLFIRVAEERKIKFDNPHQFEKFLVKNTLNYETLYNFPFTLKEGNKRIVLRYTRNYKNLIWAFLLHSKQGRGNKYPMHLFISAKKGTGKSTIVNILYEKTGEVTPVFSGVGSTMKNLVPSFAQKPAKVGYLAECSRFAYLDEFLRCLNSIRNGTSGNVHDESVGIMNDLLEHQKRETGSGNSKIKVNMTARILATTNPVRGTDTMEDMIHTLDESFLSRWLIYFQSEEDIKLARDKSMKGIEEFKYEIKQEDFLAIIDYLQSIDSNYDYERVYEIFEEPKKLMSEKILDHYDARSEHHLICLLDGIVKTRCLMENSLDFTAIEEDYNVVKDIWRMIIKSWIDVKKIKDLPQDKRLYYLPEAAQHLFYRMVEQKKVMSKDEIKVFALKTMTVPEFYNSLGILVNFELVYDLGMDQLKVWTLKEGKKEALEI